MSKDVTAPRTLLVGVGSMLGDDHVGWLAAERLAEELANESRAARGVGDTFVKLATVPLDVLDWLDGVQQLHVIDACRSDQPVGTIHRLRWSDLSGSSGGKVAELPLQLGGQTTHDFGIVDVLRLAEQMHRLPREVVIWGR